MRGTICTINRASTSTSTDVRRCVQEHPKDGDGKVHGEKTSSTWDIELGRCSKRELCNVVITCSPSPAGALTGPGWATRPGWSTPTCAEKDSHVGSRAACLEAAGRCSHRQAVRKVEMMRKSGRYVRWPGICNDQSNLTNRQNVGDRQEAPKKRRGEKGGVVARRWHRQLICK